MDRPRILFLQCGLNGHGGSNGVAAWMLDVLIRFCEVTLLTWDPVDFGQINAAFGTSIDAKSIRQMRPNFATRFLVERIPDESHFQKKNWLVRVSKRIAPQYDLAITADDESDFGVPGIQYVHYPYMAPHFGKVVLRPWKFISGFSFPSMLENLTLVNSRWTAEQYRQRYGVTPPILYPPAPGEFPRIAWEDRADDFLCLSRLESIKNHDRMISILRRVRQSHPHIRFHIFGSEDRSPKGRRYLEGLRRTVAGEAEWLSLHVNLSRARLVEQLPRFRYGLHLMPGEHFGMAVAEMLRAGVIPFCHNSGGQIEIAAQPHLHFNDDDDAVRAIDALLSSPTRIASTAQAIAQRRDRFSSARFCNDFQEIVLDFLQRRRLRHAA